MMSRNYILFAVTFVAGLLLSGCSRDDAAFPDAPGNTPPLAAWSLQVSDAGFRSDAETRTTDNGLSTTFADGDVLGLIVTSSDGSTIEHIPYRYNGSAWSAVSGSAAYYDPNAGNSYAAYFPYRAELQGKSLDDVKAAFTPLIDQSDREKGYCASDLLVCSSVTPNSTDKTLQIAFIHVHALLRVKIPKTFTSLCGPNESSTTEYGYATTVSDPIIAVDNTPYRPWIDSDDYYRLIIPGKGSDCSVNSQYTVRGKRMQNVATLTTPAAGQCYTVTSNTNLGYCALSDAHAGDFYIKSAGGSTDYLIPGEVASPLSEEVKAACVGIVYWVGDPTNSTNGDPLLETKHSTCTHGLVVALHHTKNPSTSAAAKKKWSVSTEQVNAWTNSTDRGGNQVDITVENRSQGYANTVALKAYNNESSNVHSNPNLKVLPIAAIEQYSKDYPAPANSSGWYVPSIMELKYICWGQGNGQSTTVRDLLNGQFAKVGGTNFDGSWAYWSSSENADNSSNAWHGNFSNGLVGNSSKDRFELWVRTHFAF